MFLECSTVGPTSPKLSACVQKQFAFVCMRCAMRVAGAGPRRLAPSDIRAICRVVDIAGHVSPGGYNVRFADSARAAISYAGQFEHRIDPRPRSMFHVFPRWDPRHQNLLPVFRTDVHLYASYCIMRAAGARPQQFEAQGARAIWRVANFPWHSS